MIALVLNSCFFGFYAHLGFARELERRGVAVGAACGSSAGALVAACVASGLGAARGLDMALTLGRDDFWDPDSRAGSLLRLGRVRGHRFERLLETYLPAATIEECPLPLVISAVTVPFLGKAFLDRGPLARAVRASCAVPFLLQPVPFGGNLLWDGGVRVDAPLRALLERREGIRVAIVHAAAWDRGRNAEPRLDPGLAREIAFARRRGVRVLVARTLYPRLDPDRLEPRAEAIEAGARSARRLLSRIEEAVPSRPAAF